MHFIHPTLAILLEFGERLAENEGYETMGGIIYIHMAPLPSFVHLCFPSDLLQKGAGSPEGKGKVARKQNHENHNPYHLTVGLLNDTLPRDARAVNWTFDFFYD